MMSKKNPFSSDRLHFWPLESSHCWGLTYLDRHTLLKGEVINRVYKTQTKNSKSSYPLQLVNH